MPIGLLVPMCESDCVLLQLLVIVNVNTVRWDSGLIGIQKL